MPHPHEDEHDAWPKHRPRPEPLAGDDDGKNGSVSEPHTGARVIHEPSPRYPGEVEPGQREPGDQSNESVPARREPGEYGGPRI